MAPRNQRALPSKKGENKNDEDVIIPEVVDNPPLITPQIIQIYVQDHRQDDLERLLHAEVEYNRKRLQVIREHIELHPDGIDHRRTKAFRRIQYGVLLGFTAALLTALPFVPLAAASVFGIIAILIISRVIVNARERELDLQGFVKMINTIIGSMGKKQ